MNNIKPTFKFLLFILICLVIVPLQLLLMLIHKGQWAYILPHIWHKCACLIFQINIKIIGTPHTNSQTIFVSNHVSYLDIIVMGSILKASFVAKKDVASWPVFGFLSKLQQTAFISRDKSDVKQARNALDTMVDKGKSLIIFPEGTSTEGVDVRPFKSSLFSIALKENLQELLVQSITLKMETIDNKKIQDQDDRDLYSWHINMDTPLGEHLWRFAKTKGAEISLTFHAPIKAHSHKSRKTLAKACHKAVSSIAL